MKNSQRIPPGTLNVSLTLVTNTDNALMNFVTVGVYQPGGTVTSFPES